MRIKPRSTSIDDLLEETAVEAEIVTDEKQELLAEINDKADKYKAAAKRHADNDNLEALRAIHSSLVGKTKRRTAQNPMSNQPHKVKLIIWAVGIVIGLIVGMIIAGIAGNALDAVATLDGVVGWIKFLIVIIVGGFGWFVASTITDRQR